MSEPDWKKLSKSLAQGALFIVDNAGTCPPGTTLREFHDRAIENHLQNHTYFSGPSRERVDLLKMRRKMLHLTDTRYAGTVSNPRPGETRVDAVFRLGSIALPQRMLSRYEYNKNAFSEADLPAYIPGDESDTEGHALHADPTPDETNVPLESNDGKRRHSEVADPDDASKRTSTNMTNETNTKKRQATGRSEDKSSDSVRSVEDDNTSETSPHPREAFMSHEPTSTRQDAVPPTVPEMIEPGSVGANPSSIPESQQDPQQWGGIIINVVQREFNILQSDLREAVRALLASIGRIDDLQCPLDPNPSNDLQGLFVRSWGPEWRLVSDRAITFNDFTPEFVITSLISAFLHDNILSQQVPAQRIAQSVTNLLQASGPLGEQYLHHMDLPATTSAVVKSTHIDAVNRARATLMQDEGAIQLPLFAEAKQHTETLLQTIQPQLRRLGMPAQLYNRTDVLSAVPGNPILDHFAPQVTSVIQKALNHKLKLFATGCHYAYIWPNNGDVYDPTEMKIAGAQERLPLAVRVTVFPGLKVSISGADHASLQMVSEAAVRVHRLEHPRTGRAV